MIKIGIIATGNVAIKNYLLSSVPAGICYYNRTKSKATACSEQFGGQVVDHRISDLVAWAPGGVDIAMEYAGNS